MAGEKSTRACAWCGELFVPARSSGYKYCCAEHAALAKRKSDRDREVTPEQRAAWNARYVAKNYATVRARDNKGRARVRAERGRGDRSSEYRNKRIKSALARMPTVEHALGEMAADGCRRHAHVPGLVAGIARIVEKADSAARSKIARLQRRMVKRPLSQHTINRKADRDRYAKDITRTRAKSYLRKTGNKMPDDGTASTAVLLGGARCLYCDCALNDDNRSHDHMTPLCLGGVHSAANIAPACKRCNFRKARKSFAHFVETLDEKHRRRAVAFYEKRNGPMVQLGLFPAA